MPATYSINVGQTTEAYRKPDINSVLADIPNNTQKLISPKDVRDAFLSSWANSSFKQTLSLSSIEYVGLDSGDPSNRDIKQKIFIGKRNYAGTDIMNNTLLSTSNQNDIYFYNTKPDGITQSTRISILAGTNSSLHINAPYIGSNIFNNGVSDFATLDIVNPSIFGGPVNIYSLTGRVALNGILFPTVAETSASASNGRILKYSGTYPNGSLRWADPTISISSIGSPGTPTNIYGSPSNVNGYSLEFVDDSIVPQTIGGVEIGTSFSSGSYMGQNWPLSEVIRKVLYPYVPPALTLGLSNTSGSIYAEFGVTSSFTFNYSITKYSNNIDDYQITGTTYSNLSFSGIPGSVISQTFSYPVYNTTLTGVPTFSNYVLQVSDSGSSNFTYSSTASVYFVSPFFDKFTSTDINLFGGSVNSNIGSLISTSNKTILPLVINGVTQSVSKSYVGSGYIYFLYPIYYGFLSLIKDPNGFTIHDSSNLGASTFTYSNSISPTGYNYGNYRVYKSIGTCSYSGVGTFEFIF
jgi:hypothetical protein